MTPGPEQAAAHRRPSIGSSLFLATSLRPSLVARSTAKTRRVLQRDGSGASWWRRRWRRRACRGLSHQAQDAATTKTSAARERRGKTATPVTSIKVAIKIKTTGKVRTRNTITIKQGALMTQEANGLKEKWRVNVWKRPNSELEKSGNIPIVSILMV